MMRRRWWVDDFSGGVSLLLRSALGEDAGASPEVIAIQPDIAASRANAWFPEGRGCDAPHGRLLAEIAAALGEETLGRPDEATTKQQKALVRRALRDGRLIARRVRLPAPPEGFAEPQEEARAARVAPREDTTWIEILLVDDSDPPRPQPFIRYRIELPDGAVREGMLDANGRAMLTGIDRGTCEVTFPGLDARDWSPA
jgi:hypothetical protein